MLKISTAPHLRSPRTTQTLMMDVIIALSPVFLASVFFFGVNALRVVLTSIAGCVAIEFLAGKYWFKTKDTTKNYSAVITGLLLAFNLPSTMPDWMILCGCFVAIVIAKLCFGGLGKNIFNPALAGRVFLFISFPVQMSVWPVPQIFDFWKTDVQTAATPLTIVKHSAHTYTPNYLDLFFGNTGGCIGEVSALAILMGLGYMLYRKTITWHIPVFYLGTVIAITTVFWLITGQQQYNPLFQLFSGGLMLGAVFMATDYTTSPMVFKGQILFAIGCGVLTIVIRVFSAYPEGVSFAILIMNALVPLIDKYIKPRKYGDKK